MEKLIGTLFTIPFAFVASLVYVLFLVFVVRRFPRASLWLWWAGAIVIGAFAIEVMLLATLGPGRCRAALGTAFDTADTALFFGGTPALANLLVLRRRRAGPLRVGAAVVFCTMFACGSVFLQYTVREALCGVDGDACVDYSARYSIPGSDKVVGVELTRMHAFLAEYNRVLFFGPTEGPFERVKLFPDTGGYTMVNLYRLDASTLLVHTIGNHLYRIELGSPGITEQMMNIPEKDRVPGGTPFLGAFDFDTSREWRFIPSDERPEREIGKVHMNEDASGQEMK